MNRTLSIILFLTIFTTVLGLVYTYTGWRLKFSSLLPSPWSYYAWGLLLFLLLLLPLGIIFEAFSCRALFNDIISWAAYINMGFFTLMFFFIVSRDIIYVVYTGFDKTIGLFSRSGDKTEQIQPVNFERRRFIHNLTSLGILGTSALLTGYGIYQAKRKPRVIKVKIPIAGLPGELEEFRLVQISDIHVCPTIGREFVESVVDQVNQLRPHAVALTGDLVDGSVLSRGNDVEPLKRLKASHGLFFVTGNHEYYSGVEEWIEEIRRLGFRVLLNEHELIQFGRAKILMAGATDFEAGNFRKDHRSNPQAAMRNAPDSDVKILLAHQPKGIEAASKAGFDLQLSGHTHGGQYAPFKYMVKLAMPYVSGLHRYQNTWIYVNQGTGYWGPPMRIGTEPEITLVTFRRT